MGLGHDAIPDPLIQPDPNHRAQQPPRILLPQAPDLQVRQPPKLLAGVARGEQQPHRIGQQPPRHEPQHLRGHPVQPLRVIDQAQQRPVLRRLRQQGQHRQPDQEPVWRTAAAQPERDPQRVPLRSRQPLQATQQRRAQLMNAGERQLHLRFHPHGPGHPHVRRRPGRVLQQRRLAHPRLAPHHQRPPAPGTQIPHQAVERLALPLAVHQRRGRLGSRMHACPTSWQRLAR